MSTKIITTIAAIALSLAVTSATSGTMTKKNALDMIVLYGSYNEYCERLPRKYVEALDELAETVDIKELKLAIINAKIKLSEPEHQQAWCAKMKPLMTSIVDDR
jgi:hypothetical protein